MEQKFMVSKKGCSILKVLLQLRQSSKLLRMSEKKNSYVSSRFVPRKNKRG